MKKTEDCNEVAIKAHFLLDKTTVVWLKDKLTSLKIKFKSSDKKSVLTHLLWQSVQGTVESEDQHPCQEISDTGQQGHGQ